MRDILHCDLNNFFATAEAIANPAINARYLAVSGNADSRHGIILAKNTEAKNMGVKTGEAIWQAKLKCPELVTVPPHYEYYAHFSKLVREIYCQYTDCVESFGLDECWLDVTHSKIFGTPLQIANKIRKQVKQQLGLTISVGVSFNKTFAKLGSDLKKPDATTIIDTSNYQQVVWPLPVSEMLGVGSKTKSKLNQLGIFTLGDLANADEQKLSDKFGIVGVRLKQCASGNDDTPVNNCDFQRVVKSVGHGTTTLRDMTTLSDINKVVIFLSDMVATRLRRYGLQGNVVSVDIRHNDLTHISRQCKVCTTYVSNNITAAAMKLINKMWQQETSLPLRSLTVTVSSLEEVANEQPSIFDMENDKQKRLQCSLDQIRKKFGQNAIKQAALLGNDLLSDKFFTEEDLLPFKR